MDGATLRNETRRSTVRQGRSLMYRIEPYLFILPAVLIVLVVKYYPMAFLQIAFRDYLPFLGPWRSPWVGIEHFARFVTSPQFERIVGNTIRVTFFTLMFGFPWPIAFALALNEESLKGVRNVCQTISYAPHFISIVVVVGMIVIFTSPTIGFINTVVETLGGETIHFMMEPGWFLPLYIISHVWQHLGWGAIIYLATLTTVPAELYEAATIDGATRMQKVARINLPFLLPIIVIQLILNAGRMLDVGFEKVFLMQTDLNRSASQVLSTYTYTIGIRGGQFSYASAIGLLRSLVSLALLVSVNRIARRFSETSLW